MQKRCLVISYGPVPTPEYQTVEGGGMRAWGLAKGLQANGIETTIAINGGFPQSIASHEGVDLINWSLDGQFIKTMNSFDAVVVSYCMGDLSVFVADNISDDVQLILDAYVPIYIEVSARGAKNMNEEYANYAADLERHNHTLRRGDYFLYANSAQEQLYSGVLSALGIINPFSYRTNRLLLTPFGIHRDAATAKINPYMNLGIKKDDFVVLWFGGIYPWFRIEEYLNAIKELASDKKIKFVFVGGKNPFNDNPDIARQYTKALDFAKGSKLLDTSVHFVDWVDFDTRVDWFNHADAIVSLNQPGEENKYSWRTRVMDFVWGEAAIITNGGDPLSEEMIAANAALRIHTLSSESIVSLLKDLRKKPETLVDVRKNVRSLKKKYYWDTVTRKLSAIITEGSLPYIKEEKYRKLLPEINTTTNPVEKTPNKLQRAVSLPLKVVKKVRNQGLAKTTKVALSVVRGQKNKLKNRRKSQFVFISHPIDNTGAPAVLLQIIEEYVEKYGPNRVRVIAPGVTENQENHLKSLGVKPEKAVHAANFHFIRLQLGLRPDDFVLMNTIAIYDNYRDFILLWLRLGRLKHAYWFIHEDKAQIPIINEKFTHSSNLHAIKGLVSSEKLSLLYPSKRTAEEYADILQVKGTTIKLRVEVPEKYTKEREASDFDTINILLSGSSKDGRKGQMLALSALQLFIDGQYRKNPNAYRPVHLHLLAVGKDDYISQQIRWIASSALNGYVTVYDTMPKEEAMTLTRQCNTVLCCSLNETFGLYISEGMLMGHLLLRNNSAGVDEQLQDGENGFFIDHTDTEDIAKRIGDLADKKSFSNDNLASMSRKSQEIMRSYMDERYLPQIEKVE